MRRTEGWLRARNCCAGHDREDLFGITMDFTDLYMRLDRKFITQQVRRVGALLNDPEILGLVQAIQIILRFSYFGWDNKLYLQQNGIPMGTNCGPTLANIALLGPYLPDDLNSPPHFQSQSFLMLRYIDDVVILTIATSTEDATSSINEVLSKWTTDLERTVEPVDHSLHFLDVHGTSCFRG